MRVSGEDADGNHDHDVNLIETMISMISFLSTVFQYFFLLVYLAGKCGRWWWGSTYNPLFLVYFPSNFVLFSLDE